MAKKPAKSRKKTRPKAKPVAKRRDVEAAKADTAVQSTPEHHAHPPAPVMQPVEEPKPAANAENAAVAPQSAKRTWFDAMIDWLFMVPKPER